MNCKALGLRCLAAVLPVRSYVVQQVLVKLPNISAWLYLVEPVTSLPSPIVGSLAMLVPHHHVVGARDHRCPEAPNRDEPHNAVAAACAHHQSRTWRQAASPDSPGQPALDRQARSRLACSMSRCMRAWELLLARSGPTTRMSCRRPSRVLRSRSWDLLSRSHPGRLLEKGRGKRRRCPPSPRA